MTINLTVTFRGHDLAITTTVINFTHCPAEPDIGMRECIEDFDLEEIYVVTPEKGSRIPSEKLDLALYQLIINNYGDAVSEKVIQSIEENRL